MQKINSLWISTQVGRCSCLALMLIAASCSREQTAQQPSRESPPQVQAPAPPQTAPPETQPNPSLRVSAPVDESATDPSFAAFKAELLTAIGKKDSTALLDHVAPEIKNGFGGDDGIEAFKKKWQPEIPESRIWATLGTILNLGATRVSETVFGAPYVFTRWPEDLDSFSYTAVVRKGAPLRANSDPSSTEVIRSMDYEFLELVMDGSGNDPTQSLAKVKDQTGQVGFVIKQDMRSPIDYRAYFEKRGNKWLMNFLAAGD